MCVTGSNNYFSLQCLCLSSEAVIILAWRLLFHWKQLSFQDSFQLLHVQCTHHNVWLIFLANNLGRPRLLLSTMRFQIIFREFSIRHTCPSQRSLRWRVSWPLLVDPDSKTVPGVLLVHVILSSFLRERVRKNFNVCL